MRPGGVTPNTLRLAGGLVARGVDVHLVVCEATDPYRSRIPPDVEMVDLNSPLSTRRDYARAATRLGRYLRRRGPSVLISARVKSNIVAAMGHRFAVRRSTRLVLTVRNNPREYDATNRLKVWGARASYPRADAVVAVSKGVARQVEAMLQWRKGRVETIYNPVACHDILERSRMAPFPHLSQGQGTDLIVAAGRLVPQKDFETLLRAFAKVRRGRDAHLVILGDGPEYARLQGIIDQLRLRANVDMLGFVENPYPYMKMASVFVLSSAWEGFGSVLVEAMALGTPVVSTDCPHGPMEILDGGRYGRMAAVGDHSELAEAISAELEMPHDAQSLRDRALEFSIEAAVDQWLRLWWRLGIE